MQNRSTHVRVIIKSYKFNDNQLTILILQFILGRSVQNCTQYSLGSGYSDGYDDVV